MKLKPLFDKVVVKIIEEKEEKRGSFFLPSTAQEKSEIAEVIAVGPGGNLDGKEVVMQVNTSEKSTHAPVRTAARSAAGSSRRTGSY